MAETQLITPLDSEEIKSAIITTICEHLWESLNKVGCDLYGVAYPRFKVRWTIEGVLDNFGTLIPFSTSGDLPFTPPNVLRKQTGQSIPVSVEKDDGSFEQRAVFYKREKRFGRSTTNLDD